MPRGSPSAAARTCSWATRASTAPSSASRRRASRCCRRAGRRGDEGAYRDPDGAVRLRVQAGETWDDLVAWTVEHGYSGIEALSGIPGSVGAAPVQNIGAYGQELEATLVAIEFLDEGADAPRRMTADELELGYRTSVLKQGLRGIVVSVELDLHDTALRARRARRGARPAHRLRAARRRAARAAGRPGADRARARERARAARLEGHGARPRRPRLGERRLVLHEPDRRRAHRTHAAGRGPALVRRARGARRGHAARRRSPRRTPLDAFLEHQASLETSVDRVGCRRQPSRS